MKRVILGCTAALAVAMLAPSAASAVVTPGAQTFTDGAQCTANFVFRDGGGTYLGQAAHCSGTGGATETDGCDSESLPNGTPVEIASASQPGTMVYNSWITMQARGETNPDVCAYNDFALVKLSAADAATVDPTVPRFGGPTSVADPPSNTGATVYTYGNSSLRGGVTQLSPKQGTVVQSQGNGWSRDVYTATPGIPGDSGSGFLSSTGQAIGVLSTVQLAPLAGSNGVGNLSKELAYANQFGGFGGLALVPGTRPFNPNIVAAIAGL
jgi:Trypsin